MKLFPESAPVAVPPLVKIPVTLFNVILLCVGFTSVTNPYMSECGRFEVDPITYYGLTEKELNENT